MRWPASLVLFSEADNWSTALCHLVPSLYHHGSRSYPLSSMLETLSTPKI
jgi:hypothetical protein